jgi:hypothetical protein
MQGQATHLYRYHHVKGEEIGTESVPLFIVRPV